jgi:hypothetical protein
MCVRRAALLTNPRRELDQVNRACDARSLVDGGPRVRSSERTSRFDRQAGVRALHTRTHHPREWVQRARNTCTCERPSNTANMRATRDVS